MANRRIKNLGKRALSLFLVLVMMTGLLQISAFAAAFQNQTMDGYYTVDAAGNPALTNATSVTEDGFTLSKTIQQTGMNTFNITLQVVTSQVVTTNAAAIQLVIDTSKSMEDCAEGCGKKDGCSHDDRLTAIKKILTNDGGFLDSLIGNNSGKLYVSVISFNSGAATVCDWTDITASGNLSTVKKAINELTTDTGTNIHAGLMLARNRLTMDAVSTAGAKFTILLSDGEANRTADESTSTDSISGSSKGGKDNKDDQDSKTSKSAGGSNSDDATTLAASMAATLKTMSSVYAVGYGVEASYLETILGSSANVFVGADSAAINGAFSDIAKSAASGMSGAGTAVTDPMGEYILLGDVSSLSGDGVSAAGNTISWALDPAKAQKSTSGNTTTYTYTITYPITLDTAAEGFREKNQDGSTKYYPTNGYTYLNVPQADGSNKQIAFLVPGVCGEIPQVNWKIEYYLQDEASIGTTPTYTMDQDATKGPVELWTSVNAPDGYEDAYKSGNYKFAGGSVVLEIRPDRENVMKLYYNLITAPVTVNHFYKTDLILADGTEVPGEYPETPDKSNDPVVCRADTEFTADLETSFGNGSYELESADPSQTIKVTEDGSNTVNLYYTREVDQRVITSARVNHVYTTYGYELQDGKYVLAQQGSKNETAEQAAEIRATTVFNVSPTPMKGYEDFTLNEELGDYGALLQSNDTLSFIVADEAEENVRTLYFEKIIDNREEVEVTVNHYYTKTTTTIKDGKAVTTVDPDRVLGSTSTETAYVGEKLEVSEINVYHGETYHSDATNAAKLTINALTGDVTIDLYYSLSVTPEKTSLVVNHIWRTFTEVTVEKTKEVAEEVTDPETGETTTVTRTVVTGTDTVTRESKDHEIDGSEAPVELYMGQSYTAPKESWGQGYAYNHEDSQDTGIGGTDEVLTLYYDRWLEDDERREAEIDVQHNYVTHLTTIVDGEVKTVDIPDGSETERFPAGGEKLKAGDAFTATAATTYHGKEYTRITAEDALGPVVLQPGTNATIVIDYERVDSDLVDTDYTVHYEYRTYTMTVGADGVAAYGAPAAERIPGTPAAGYVDQEVVLDPGTREGFTALATNPAAAQILAADGNTWTFIHEKYLPLEQGSVVVNHHYTTRTIAIDGTVSSHTEDVNGTAVIKYVGERCTAAAVPNGFRLTGLTVDGAAAGAAESTVVTVGACTVVDFYYEKTVDNSVSAPYSIAHEYYLYDWDGTLLSASKPEAAAGTGYVTNPITGSPEPNDYTLTSVTYNGETLEAPYTVNLIDGNNDIVFVYEKTLARDLLDVTILHNYYQDEAALAEGAEPLAVYQETAANVPEESEHTAELRNEEGYTFYSADPESLTITVSEDGDNVITLNYVRASAAYQVIHIYNRNGVEDGRTSEILGGLDGDVVTADSIAPVTGYGGRTYTFVSVTGDITLDTDEMQTITLTYNRTVSSPGTPNSPKPDPVPPSVEIIDEDIPPLAELPDENLPLMDLPEEEVPLANVPKTGDTMAISSVLIALAATSLVALRLIGKKDEDGEEL